MKYLDRMNQIEAKAKELALEQMKAHALYPVLAGHETFAHGCKCIPCQKAAELLDVINSE